MKIVYSTIVHTMSLIVDKSDYKCGGIGHHYLSGRLPNTSENRTISGSGHLESSFSHPQSYEKQ